jgi:hypothetical protein
MINAHTLEYLLNNININIHAVAKLQSTNNLELIYKN